MMLSMRGYIFFGLNGVRALSIVALILVFSSSIVVMTKDVEAVNALQAVKQSGNITTVDSMLNCDYIEGSTVPNQAAGVFWAVLNRLLIIFQAIMLFLSEIGWPAAFFERFFPVLGPDFGLGPLGIFQCLIGATILSHHVDDFTLVAAFFLFSLGCLNMLLGLIFRENAKPKRSIAVWRSAGEDLMSKARKGAAMLPRSYDLRPSSTVIRKAFSGDVEKDAMKERDGASFDSWRSGTTAASGTEQKAKTGFGFGRQGEKAAGLRGFVISKPLESLPRYAAPPRLPSHHTPSARSHSPTHSYGSSASSHTDSRSPSPVSSRRRPAPPLTPPNLSRFSDPSVYSAPSRYSHYTHERRESEVPEMPPLPRFHSSGTAL